MSAADTSTAAERLSPSVRRFLSGVALSALGNGLVLPFLMVYLHEVRGMGTATVGLVLAWMAAVGLGLGVPAGTLVDKIGPRPVLICGVTIMGLGTASLAIVEVPVHAFAAATIMAAGGAGLYGPTSAMIASLVPAEQRQRVYGIQFALLNLGIGVGGLVAAVIADVDRAGSFQLLYVLDGLTFFGYAVVLLTMRGAGGPAAHAAETDQSAGWRTVLEDRVLRRVVFMVLLGVTSGYAQLEAGFTAFATQKAGLDPKLLGIAFAANTGMIVAGQMLVLKRLEGRSRSRALTAALVIWAFSWLFIGAAGLVPGTGLATALLIVAPAIFAIGETMWAPIGPAVVNDLAPPQLRGRYNAAISMTWGVSFVIGPLVAGLLIGGGLAGLWITAVVGGCLAAAVLATRLRAHLTSAQDGRTAGEPEPVPAGALAVAGADA